MVNNCLRKYIVVYGEVICVIFMWRNFGSGSTREVFNKQIRTFCVSCLERMKPLNAGRVINPYALRYQLIIGLTIDAELQIYIVVE